MLMAEPRFRAAFDFMELRAKAGEPVQELVTWWQAYIEGDNEKRRDLINALGVKKRKKSRRRRAPPPSTPVGDQ
jgi:poly(A) polymerase